MRADTVAYIAVFALVALALFYLLRLDDAIAERASAYTERTEKIRSLRKTRLPGRIMRRLVSRCAELISASRMPRAAYIALTLLCAVGGYTAGRIVFSSTVISFAVGTLGAVIPLLYFSFRQNKTRHARLEQLASSMSILSNSYVVTEDIITSVRESLDILDYPAPFREFLAYITMMDSSMEKGLRRMERQVNNSFFSQWVDALILAQDDRSLKFATVTVAQSMHDMLSVQADADAAMYAVWRDYATTLVLIFSVPLVFRFTLPDAYITLTTSTGGQILFVLLLATVVFSVIQALRINKPLMV